MNDNAVYRIDLAGEADEGEINALSPLQVAIERREPGSSLLIVCTDQSGLIGLIRHLHGLGFVLLGMQRDG